MRLAFITSQHGQSYKNLIIINFIFIPARFWQFYIHYNIKTISLDEDILLSSGSKDGMIRLWRMSSKKKKKSIETDLLEAKTIQIKLSSKDCDETNIVNCSLESVLNGHEGIVSSLDWEGSNYTYILINCSNLYGI